MLRPSDFMVSHQEMMRRFMSWALVPDEDSIVDTEIAEWQLRAFEVDYRDNNDREGFTGW